jgi:hypothetical protein
MSIRHITPFILTLVATTAACASARFAGGPVSRSDRPHLVRTAEGRLRVLTAADIARVDARTAYDAIARLRPIFLGSARMTNSAERPVYVDGIRFGLVEQLRDIPAGTVREIRLLNAVEATNRFGTGHSSGALVVSTKTGP